MISRLRIVQVIVAAPLKFQVHDIRLVLYNSVQRFPCSVKVMILAAIPPLNISKQKRIGDVQIAIDRSIPFVFFPSCCFQLIRYGARIPVIGIFGSDVVLQGVAVQRIELLLRIGLAAGHQGLYDHTVTVCFRGGDPILPHILLVIFDISRSITKVNNVSAVPGMVQAVKISGCNRRKIGIGSFVVPNVFRKRETAPTAVIRTLLGKTEDTHR